MRACAERSGSRRGRKRPRTVRRAAVRLALPCAWRGDRTTGLAASAVLSTNSAWPVRFVCTSHSVCERHGLPHSAQTSESTASVLSLKSACPVASPWSCASRMLRSARPHVLHFRLRAVAIAADACAERSDNALSNASGAAGGAAGAGGARAGVAASRPRGSFAPVVPCTRNAVFSHGVATRCAPCAPPCCWPALRFALQRRAWPPRTRRAQTGATASAEAR